MKKLISITLTIMMLSLSGCTNHNPQSATLKLTANASTGYEWKTNLDNKGIIEIKTAYHDSKHKNLAGAPGTFQIDIKAVKTGKVILTLDYLREWEKDNIYQLTYEISVNQDLKLKIGKASGNYTEITLPEFKISE